MQTWLPVPDYEETARVLDPRRLGKQRVEVLQIIRAMNWPKYGWRHHPAVRMWRGYDRELIRYGLTICDEWGRRGYRDTVKAQLVELDEWFAAFGARRETPPWLGWEPMHRSHRSALLRKEPQWYRILWPDERGDLPYVWPDPDPDAWNEQRRSLA